MKIGIIGNGFVGKATALLLDDVLIYDINPQLCLPKNITINDLQNQCKFIFICVPTPMLDNGKCYLGMVENVINQLDLKKNHIILRSTVPVGTCRKLGVNFMPEFLTEKNWKNDFINCENWIIGADNPKFCEDIIELFNLSKELGKINFNNIHFSSLEEAEAIKLFRNNFLAVKVAFCNEFFNFCNSKNISYENIRQLACLDKRIGFSHTMVPGHDGLTGFGGTCFPKDLNSLIYQMDENEVPNHVLKAVKYRNENIDRKGDDWKEEGRSFINSN